VRRRAARYNGRPVEVPRDEMWAAIQASRRAAPAPITVARSATRVRRQLGWWMGLAATLLLGVAIGRFALGTPAASNDGTTVAKGATSATPADSAAHGVGFDIVADQHMARAEALLTTYRAADGAKADPAADERTTLWARNMLSNTRLLLDSPAAADPARKQLLEDLELVLVQLVQRSPQPGAKADDRQHIERSMERTHMIPRLRSAQQAGMTRGT